MPASLLSKHITAQSCHRQWARDTTAAQSPKRRCVAVLTAQHEVTIVRDGSNICPMLLRQKSSLSSRRTQPHGMTGLRRAALAD